MKWAIGFDKSRIEGAPAFLLLMFHRKEETMGDIIHQSHITITREKGPTRIAHIRGFDKPVYYGVHGGIKKFYNVDPEEEHAATLDHLVGAVGG